MTWGRADKKAAKFRDWLDGPNLIDAKPNQTVLELLGFLAYETVGEVQVIAAKSKKTPQVVPWALVGQFGFTGEKRYGRSKRTVVRLVRFAVR